MREARPDISITTDIIVGFPGETDEDYQETRSMCERVKFDNAFVFRYSKRKDTPAAELEGQLPERVKEERNQDLLALINKLSRPGYENLVGKTVEILCEGTSKTTESRLVGRTSSNRIVVFEGDKERHTGELFDVKIRELHNFTLYGDAVLVG